MRKAAVDDAEIDATARLIYETGLLKLSKRTGWWLCGVKDPESIAERSFRTAIMRACSPPWRAPTRSDLSITRTRTFRAARARSMAAGAPPQRPPTTMTRSLA